MATERRDFVAIAKAYAKRVADPQNGHRFGIWIRLAGKRFLHDMKRATEKDAPFYFDAWHAFDVCDFAEKLPHVEGKWETPNIVLHESHIFFLVNLFGFRNQDSTRRFTIAVFAVGRKNAKSTLASVVGLYCQNCEGENGPQVISGATTGSQARVIFGVAKKMVERTSDLREAFGLEGLRQLDRQLQQRRIVQADQRQGEHARWAEPIVHATGRAARAQEPRPVERAALGRRRAPQSALPLHDHGGLREPGPVAGGARVRQEGAARADSS